MDFLDRTLENFREYLKENTDSKNTVKNYVSDLRIFLIFLDSRHSPITADNFPRFLNTQTLTEFSDYLSVINPPATLNRRVSSVKKFFDYYMEHHPLPQVSAPAPVTFSSAPVQSQPAEIIDAPQIQSEIVTPEPIPVPSQNESIDELEPSSSESTPDTVPEENHNLLRLLPEELMDNEENNTVARRDISTPPNFFATYKIQIICTLSFLVGFFSTMAVYPLLYP